MSRFTTHSCLILACGVLLMAQVLAQAPAPTPGAPSGGVAPPPRVETQPLPPPATAPSAEAPKPAESNPSTGSATPASPPAAPAPAAPQQAAPAPAPAAPPVAPPAAAPPSQQAAPAPGTIDPLANLSPGTTDPSGADEVMLAPKNAAALRGTANWDGGFLKIQAALAVIRAEMAKANIKPAGRAITIFLSSDDEKFTFDAMVPIDPAANMTTALGQEVRLTQTPAGMAIRFGHKGAYDNIDETYEVLTAYLDAKGIEAKDAFIEEYLTENISPSDENFELHVYVQPK